MIADMDMGSLAASCIRYVEQHPLYLDTCAGEKMLDFMSDMQMHHPILYVAFGIISLIIVGVIVVTEIAEKGAKLLDIVGLFMGALENGP